MLRDLVKLANHLDSKGLTKEADYIDSLIKGKLNSDTFVTIASEMNFDPVEIKGNRLYVGGSEIDSEIIFLEDEYVYLVKLKDIYPKIESEKVLLDTEALYESISQEQERELNILDWKSRRGKISDSEYDNLVSDIEKDIVKSFRKNNPSYGAVDVSKLNELDKVSLSKEELVELKNHLTKRYNYVLEGAKKIERAIDSDRKLYEDPYYFEDPDYPESRLDEKTRVFSESRHKYRVLELEAISKIIKMIDSGEDSNNIYKSLKDLSKVPGESFYGSGSTHSRLDQKSGVGILISIGCGFFAVGNLLSDDESLVIIFDKSIPEPSSGKRSDYYHNGFKSVVIRKSDVTDPKYKSKVSDVNGCDLGRLYKEQHSELDPIKKREGELPKYENNPANYPKDIKKPLSFEEFKIISSKPDFDPESWDFDELEENVKDFPSSWKSWCDILPNHPMCKVKKDK
jgi:hypothetical protein